MTQINTVSGPIDSDDLGFTLMHEHVMVCASGLSESYPDLLGEDRETRAVAALSKARELGVATIVDATTFDLGRNAPLLKAVLDLCCHPLSTSGMTRSTIPPLRSGPTRQGL